MLPDEDLVDDGTDADFDAGYSEAKTGKPPESGEVKGSTTTAETTAGDGNGEQTTPAAGADATPAAPEFVQFTKKEAEEMRAAVAKTAAYDKQLASLNGSVGFLKQHIKPAADATAGKEGATTTPAADADAAENQKYINTIIQHETDVLATEYPNWREIVGAPETGGAENVDPKHPFRVWLGAQTTEYQAKINNANSSIIIMRAIEKFNDDAAKAKAKPQTPSPQTVQRRAVIKDAIQPRGDGGQQPPGKTEDDHFNEGFASG